MNDFDLLIEKYSRELIDAKRRSILSEIEDLPRTEDVEEQITEIFEDNSNDVNEELIEEAVDTSVPDSPRMTDDVNSITPEIEQINEAQDISDNLPPFVDDGESDAAISDELSEAENASNTGYGALRVQVYAADQTYPIAAANVAVTENEKDEILFQGYTDTSGIIDDIILPAPSKEMSNGPTKTKPYSQYDINVSHPRFNSRRYINVPVFEGKKSVQTVQLVPNDNNGNVNGQTVTTIERNDFLIERSENDNG